MLNKLKKSNAEGFTIIEVMIVLAIAGLIILIVLLAVPALQRNGRNTAIKNDASAVTAAISEYESNNDGVLPKAINQTAGSTSVTICDAATCGNTVAPATFKVQSSTTVAYKGATATAATATASPGIGNVWVYTGARCDGTPSPRAAQVIYAIENSSGSNAKCIDA